MTLHKTKPTLFCLHFLGGSAREWLALSARFGDALLCVAIDLPGFGSEADKLGVGVAGMADFIAMRVRAVAPDHWWIAGHSMGAKVALALARRAEDGAAGLEGFAGLVLLAGSPPSPEPMDDDKRNHMMSWIDADAATRQMKANTFVSENVGAPLDPPFAERAVMDVLRANPSAWKAWLSDGSREDWCETVGVLRCPALILSGTADGDLGPAVQTALMAPHLAHHRHVPLEGAGHLLPMERPDEVAHLVLEFIHAHEPVGVAPPALPDRYRALIASDRVNSRLRNALLERAEADDPCYQPVAIDPVELSILRVVCDHVLPQEDRTRIDLAARIDARLGRGGGDGWRFIQLPSDVQAYRAALRTLDAMAQKGHGVYFVSLDEAARNELLQTVEAKRFEPNGSELDTEQMHLWFEDLRADVVRTYLAHPVSLARLGYSGIGAGGDDAPTLPGFKRIGIGERDPWEPSPEPVS